MLLFLHQGSFKVSEERMWLAGADDFLILASPTKPCSAISLTLRWFPVARKKPIIYLLALLQVCKQSLAARQKADSRSSAITESLKGQAEQGAGHGGIWVEKAGGRECYVSNVEVVSYAYRCVVSLCGSALASRWTSKPPENQETFDIVF